MAEDNGAGELPRGITADHSLRDGARPRPTVLDMAWSPAADRLVVGDAGGGVSVWDADRRTSQVVTPTGTGRAADVDWSSDGTLLAGGTDDGWLVVWHASDLTEFTRWRFRAAATAVTWSPDGTRLAAGSERGEVIVWAIGSPHPVVVRPAEGRAIRCLAWSPDGTRLACGDATTVEVVALDEAAAGTGTGTGGDGDGTGAGVAQVVLEVERPRRRHLLFAAAWAPQGWLATASHGGVTVWDVTTGEPARVLEGHLEAPSGLAVGAGGRLLASRSDGELILWRTDSWVPVWRLANPRSDGVHGVAFGERRPGPERGPGAAGAPVRLAVRSNTDQVALYRIDVDALLGAPATVDSVRYTTAKIVLVGDSGVGKTGLGHRLATGAFTEHSSTHGQQFWPLDQLSVRRDDGTECEAVLWDLAGQPDYRLTHSLFLDDADLAVLVFDPTDGREPLAGVDFWRAALRTGPDGPGPDGPASGGGGAAGGRPGGDRASGLAAVLVGARADRGTLALPPGQVDAYCRQHGIAGGYVETSARTGAGLDDLLGRLRSLVDWDAMPPTVTTRTFKRIKERVLAVKSGERDAVVVTPAALRMLVTSEAPGEPFTDAEMMAATRHLQRHGFVALLRTAAGDEVVLLRPELLNNLASSFVLEARRSPKGLGALDEAQLRPGGYPFPELAGLPEEDQVLLLDAVTMLFLERNVCFRETVGAQSLLVFPELINLRRPDVDDEAPLREDTAYLVRGTVDNAYASLVVLLGYTNVFRRTAQWADEARYEMRGGARCGLRQVGVRPGEVELTLLFEDGVSDAQRATFRGLVEDVLAARTAEVDRHPPLRCGACGAQQERELVRRRQRKGRSFLHCEECGERIEIPLRSLEPWLTAEQLEEVARQRDLARRRTDFESALTSVRRRVTRRPSCFVSYAWGDPDHESWVADQLVRDLAKADVDVVHDRGVNRYGDDIARFVERVTETDHVLVVGTEAYLDKHRATDRANVVAAEMDLINQRMMSTPGRAARVIPVLRAGTPETALPPFLRGRLHVDLRREDDYLLRVFELVLDLHAIDPTTDAVADLLAPLRPDHPAS